MIGRVSEEETGPVPPSLGSINAYEVLALTRIGVHSNACLESRKH